MHRHNAFRRQNVVEIRENRLLHLARISRTADQNDLAGKIAGDDRFGPATVPLRIGLEARQIDDRHLRNVGSDFGCFRTDQKISDEKGMPCEFGIDARLDAVSCFRSAE